MTGRDEMTEMKVSFYKEGSLVHSESIEIQATVVPVNTREGRVTRDYIEGRLFLDCFDGCAFCDSDLAQRVAALVNKIGIVRLRIAICSRCDPPVRPDGHEIKWLDVGYIDYAAHAERKAKRIETDYLRRAVEMFADALDGTSHESIMKIIYELEEANGDRDMIVYLRLAAAHASLNE